MDYILYFYLAHFLADYPFQSGALVRMKKQRFLGVFIHSSVHLVTLTIFLAPLLHDIRTWLGIALMYITHNIIDQTKVTLDKENPKCTRFLYFLDQFMHCLILAIAAWIVKDVEPSITGKWLDIYLNKEIVLYALILVLSTYVYDVSRYFVKLEAGKPYKRDYKTMLRNALIVTVAFAVYWLAY